MLKYTNLDDAAQCLREIGNQFVCPPDEFFWKLADAIESLQDAYEIMRGAELRNQADKIRDGDRNGS